MKSVSKDKLAVTNNDKKKPIPKPESKKKGAPKWIVGPLPSQIEDPELIKQKDQQKKLMKDVEKAASKQLEQIRPKNVKEHFQN